jgi:hypothetical protein
MLRLGHSADYPNGRFATRSFQRNNGDSKKRWLRGGDADCDRHFAVARGLSLHPCAPGTRQPYLFWTLGVFRSEAWTLAATIQKIRVRKPCPRRVLQFIVEMVAPTFRELLGTRSEVGAALSSGSGLTTVPVSFCNYIVTFAKLCCEKRPPGR